MAASGLTKTENDSKMEAKAPAQTLALLGHSSHELHKLVVPSHSDLVHLDPIFRHIPQKSLLGIAKLGADSAFADQAL